MLINLRVAGSNPAGQLLIYFHNVFPVLTKTLCRHASLVPRSCIKAFMHKTMALLMLAFTPLVSLAVYMVRIRPRQFVASSSIVNGGTSTIHIFMAMLTL